MQAKAICYNNVMIGIDEVGRGCWAGPLLVVAARAKAKLPYGLTDSKLLSKKKREAMYFLLADSCQFGEGWVEPAEIDALGLTRAMEVAVSRALSNLGAEAEEEIVIDGSINYCAPTFVGVRCVVKADVTHPIVSAASIHAKVRRDSRMTELSAKYPWHGFDKHVGYGTKEHLAALQQFGLTPLHRQSYKPVRQFI